jgi:DNA-binding transcriptional regulator LsrR (DeoR family)
MHRSFERYGFETRTVEKVPMASTTPADDELRPAQRVLLTSVARRHYLEGWSKSQIADHYGISRFRVARLITQGRESGLVTITIADSGPIDTELSDRLRDRFGLKHALVVSTDTTEPLELRSAIGQAAADLISEVTDAHDVLGVAWSRAISTVAARLRDLPACPVVQLTGSLSGGDIGEVAVDVVRQIARTGGGPAYCFFVPMIVPTAGTARDLRHQPDVARAVAQLPKVTRALVSIGGWAPGKSTVFDALTAGERRELHKAGVRVEISGILLDRDGQPVRTATSERLIVPTAEQLGAIPEVIATVYGDDKTGALACAMRSGLIHGLVTHTRLAEKLLSEAD